MELHAGRDLLYLLNILWRWPYISAICPRCVVGLCLEYRQSGTSTHSPLLPMILLVFIAGFFFTSTFLDFGGAVLLVSSTARSTSSSSSSVADRELPVLVELLDGGLWLFSSGSCLSSDPIGVEAEVEWRVPPISGICLLKSKPLRLLGDDSDPGLGLSGGLAEGRSELEGSSVRLRTSEVVFPLTKLEKKDIN